MSLFRPKYKIEGRLRASGMVYRVYVRKYWFIFPYWKRQNSELFDQQDALLRLGLRMAADALMAEKFLRIM
jgi:hypothetical protein